MGEWCHNNFGKSQRIFFGGAWNDEPYIATFDNNAKNPFDRSYSNGFRCVKLLNDKEKYDHLYQDIDPGRYKDYYSDEIVEDEVFNVFLNQYVYDSIDLAPNILYQEEYKDWIKEKIELSVPYEQGKLTIYIFTPKLVKPSFQTLIFFPMIDSRNIEQSEGKLLLKTNDFLVKNGRAVVYPIFKGTYERKFSSSRDCNDRRICDKEEKILAMKDLKITIDYKVLQRIMQKQRWNSWEI